VILNLLLIEIFALAYYPLYFILLALFLYFFSNKIELYKITIILSLLCVSGYFFESYIFELFLQFNIYNYYVHVDMAVFIILSLLHIVLLKFVSYYFDLKKMGYNLVKN
jgi:hypothetical protein